MKFSTKIFLLFSIFVLVIILPLGMFLHHVATKIILEQITQNLQKQADRDIDKIDWIVFEHAADMKVLSNFITKNYTYSPSELTNQLIYIRDTYKIYASLAFFDQHRVKVADTAKKSLGEMASDSIWVQEVYEQGITSIAREVYFSPELQQVVVVFATPVWGDDALLGALVTELPVKNLLNQFDINTTEHIHIDLVNNQGLLLYSNHDSHNLLQRVIKTNTLNSSIFGYDHEKSVFTSATEKGYLDFSGNGWTLIVHYQEKDIFKPLIESRNQLIFYGLILLSIAILAVIFFAHRIIHPVLSLKAAAQRLGQGYFDIQVPTTSKDEIGKLAHAFNQTANLLKNQFTELKQFRTIVDIAMDNIFIIDAHTMRFIYVNDNVVTTMGYSKEEMMQMTPLDIDAVQSAEQVGLTLEPLMTGKISIFRFETVHRRKNGRTYPVEISLQYIEVNQDHQYYVAVARDISERKQAEQLMQEYNQQLKREIAAQTAELLAHTEALAEKNQQLQQESEKRQQISISLRQKEEFLRLVIDNIPQLIFWKDINSVYLGCNRHTALLNNFEHHDEIIGKTDYELIWSPHADKYRQDDQRVMKNDQAELHIIELYNKGDDEESWLETNKIPLHDANGSVVGILGTAEDITLRRKAEQFLKEYNQRLEEEIAAQTKELEAQNEELIAQTEILEEKTYLLQQEVTQRQQIETALRQSEERFALAMEGANDGLWDWNLETGEIYYSKRWKAMLGFTENELPNKTEVFFERIHPDDKIPMEQTVTRYINKESNIYEMIVRLRHKDNNYRWILTRGTGLWNEAGKAVRLVGTHVDLTKQKQIETALAESERRFRELHDGLRDGIASIDFQGRIIQFNQSFRRILACYTEEEIYQLAYQDITPEKWHAFEVTILQEQVLTRGYSELYEKEYALKDGSIIPIEIQAYLMLDEQNNPSHIWGIVRDISERKQAERALQQAKETAEVANRAKSSFLANMSHELRTPLNGILGYAQILNRDSSITSKQREGIAIIQRSGEYLLTLINDILDLAKIEAGRIELYETDVHFEEFIQSIAQLFKVRAEQKGITFFYERLSPLPAGIRIDEKRLRQILINLLGNAVKFTTDGGVSLKISYENHKVNFWIEDTGVGIASDELEGIFHPFQQVGDQNQRAEGTGLGLSITQRLAEKMGGDLSVTSELRKGSIFQITLPVVEVSNVLIKKSEFKPMITGFEGKVRHILIIDDKVENRLVLVNLLTPLGFTISEAHHGQEGLEKANEIKPDIVLTDLVMPVMDGFEFTRRFRKIAHFNQVPVIAVSASVFDYHQQQSIDAGCNTFLPKPIDADALLNTLQEYLDLIWIYEVFNPAHVQNIQSTPSEKFEITTNYPLSVDDATQLYQLGLEGDVAAILDIVERLKSNVELQPLMEKITQFAKRFDTDSVSNLVRSYLTPANSE